MDDNVGEYMSKMDKILTGEHVAFPTNWDDLGTRKTSFADVFLDLLKKRGYTNPVSLKVKGAYAFELDSPNGGKSKIGLKTAYDGWLNTAHKMVELVDTVWIMSFRWDDAGEEPIAIDVHEIIASDLLHIFDKIHAERTKLHRQKDHTYLPVLDATRAAFLKNYPDHYACGEGALEQWAELIYTAPLVWTDKGRPGIIAAQAQPSLIPALTEPLQGEQDITKLLAEALRVAVARANNTTSDKVKVSYTVDA